MVMSSTHDSPDARLFSPPATAHLEADRSSGPDSTDPGADARNVTQTEYALTDSVLNAVRVALHVPSNLLGMATALEVAAGCISIAAQHYKEEHLLEWSTFAQNQLKHLRSEAAKGSADATRWYQRISRDGGPQSRIVYWQISIKPTENEERLSTLLGRAIAVAVTLKTGINPALINGLHTLRNAYRGKGRCSACWHQLTEVDLLDVSQMKALLEKTDPRAVHAPFISAALSVLKAPIGKPHQQTRPLSPHTAEQAGDSTRSEDLSKQKDGKSGSGASPDSNEPNKRAGWKREELTPDVSARLAAADYTDFGHKLGFVTRDHIVPDDLMFITRRLADHLKSEDRKHRIYSLFHLVCLLTGCTDFIALKLEFHPCNSIWIDIRRGCWCWDFKKYRLSDGQQTSVIETSEPIYISLPHDIARGLRELHQQAPDAQNLNELLAAPLGEELDLEAARDFLKANGHAAHPAYGGRFARSMPFVFLQTCSSDMTAALLSGHFAVAAPASLFYFGPSYQVLHERLSRAYSFLGLERPGAPLDPGARAGCQKVLEPSLLETGWRRWQAEVTHLHTRVTSNRTVPLDMRNINRLMALLCAGFVIQTGHRGTRLDRLTFGALFLMKDALLISDKELDDHVQPRLIGKTETVRSILLAAASLHSLIRQNHSMVFDHDECLFVTWRTASQTTSEPVTTGGIAEVTAQFFEGSDANFGRSTWVTYLDEDGCDRWLIRTLTGHARDVTRTNSAYFDTPPKLAAQKLTAAMEATGQRLFGTGTILFSDQEPTVEYQAQVQAKTFRKSEFKVPDPRSVLDPLAASTLAGWRATVRVRQVLLEGQLLASAPCLAMLHMLFIDLVPAPHLCINAIAEPDQFLFRKGHASGLMWMRPHFVHPTWLPLLPTSIGFLRQARETPISEVQLWLEITKALRSIDQNYWSEKVDVSIRTAIDATRSFLRLNIPPSCLAVSSEHVPSPTLSPLSLLRLVERQENCSPLPTAVSIRTHTRAATRPDDIKKLKEIISEQSSQTTRLGELRQRALNSLALIRQDFHPESPFSTWLGDWASDELQRAAQGEKGRLDISSIGTYLSVLAHRPKRELSLNQEDPYEWSEDQWLSWTNALNHDLLTPSTPSAPLGQGTEQIKTKFEGTAPLCKRVRDAIGRLVRNLIKREQWIPLSVLQLIADPGEQLPNGSASSSLITREDLDRAIQIAAGWLKDQPLDRLMVKSRAEIQFSIPTRSADISNLQVDCMTSSGMLVVERVGYKNIKTENSIRTIQTSPELEKLIMEHRQELLNYRPQAKFLFRLDGTPVDGRRDVDLIGLMSSALKTATGDTSARPHSLRSSALQNMAWPGWSDIAHEILTGKATPTSCNQWVTHNHNRWTGLAQAAYMAGHGDLRPALGNYLSGWNMVCGAQVMAMLAEAPPHPGLLHQLGINPAGLRKFRQRASPCSCEWGWVFSRLQCQMSRDPAQHTISQSGIDVSGSDVQEPHTEPTQALESPPNIERDIQYLSSRILGLSKPEAMEATSCGMTKANELDCLMPPLELIELVSRRARDSAQARGQRGNLDVLFSDQGKAVLDWVTGIDEQHRSASARMVFKLGMAHERSKDWNEFWRALVQKIPVFGLLKVHRGDKYISEAERAFFFTHDHCTVLKVDGEIGALPNIQLVAQDANNRVLGSRLNSVFRACLLSSLCIDGEFKHAD